MSRTLCALFAALGAAAATAILLMIFGLPARPQVDDASGARASEGAASASDGFAFDLAQRLQCLENRMARFEQGSRGDAPRQVEANGPASARGGDFEERLKALESRVLNPKKIGLQWVVPEPSGSASADHKVIAERLHRISSANYIRAAFRIPLHMEYLQRWPQSAEAMAHLKALVDDLAAVDREPEAMAMINRFAPSMNVPSLQVDELRLRIATRPLQMLEIANRLISTGQRPWLQARAMNKKAQALDRVGRTRAAIDVVDTLIRQFTNVRDAINEVRHAKVLRADFTAKKR